MKKIVNFLVDNAAGIAARLTTKSPKVFANMQKVFGILSAVIGVVLYLIDHGLWNPSFAPLVVEYGGYVIAVGTAIFATSTLPVKDQEKKEEKQEAIKAAITGEVVGDRPPPRQKN